MIASKKIASDVVLFGLFWICIFGHWHTVNALGDDTSIYLVDFDETAYDLYLKGYYPSDYTYDDFRRNSIESMTSHYVATDSNNFSAIVDTIEQDVLLNGWSVIDNFFENAWINLKTGDITVARGFTDDFKHELDGRFKTSGTTINGHHWEKAPMSFQLRGSASRSVTAGNGDIYYTTYGTSSVNFARGVIFCSVTNYSAGSGVGVVINNFYSGSLRSGYYGYNQNGNEAYGLVSCTGFENSEYSSTSAAIADFFGYLIIDGSSWTGVGYYSDTPTNYNINLPALPYIDWSSISNNNKTKYGVDFPDIDLSVDFQLPDSYYPQTVTYDTPYWLYNTDSTPVDWVNVSFEDVTLPSVHLSDGDASFFQALFNTLPLAFLPIFLGVILCYLIFLML